MHRSTEPPPRRSARTARAGLGIGAAAILIAVGALAAVHVAGSDGTRPAAHTLAQSASAPAAPGSPSAGASSTPTPRGTPAPRPPASRPAPAPARAAAPQACTKPQFVTSDPTGGWPDGKYYLYNDMWNIAGYSVRQTMYACAYNNWYVVATMNNASGDGAVKTYPNAHEDFSSPAISSFHSISSTFAETSPQVGIYEDAYDIWINGVASSGSTEVMIWTENHGQSPGGSVVGTVSSGGRGYHVYKNGSYIAFVADTNFTSGTVNLLAFFDFIITKGWIPPGSTLGQVDYGVELVSTNGAPATFSFTDFSVSTS